jgi:hypothetical protein
MNDNTTINLILLDNRRFLELLPGLLSDPRREVVVLERLAALAQLGG